MSSRCLSFAVFCGSGCCCSCCESGPRERAKRERCRSCCWTRSLGASRERWLTTSRVELGGAVRTWVEGRPALGGSPGTPREDGLAHARFESWRLMSPLSRRDRATTDGMKKGVYFSRQLFFWFVRCMEQHDENPLKNKTTQTTTAYLSNMASLGQRYRDTVLVPPSYRKAATPGVKRKHRYRSMKQTHAPVNLHSPLAIAQQHSMQHSQHSAQHSQPSSHTKQQHKAAKHPWRQPLPPFLRGGGCC